MHYSIILNPNAANRTAAKIWESLRPLLEHAAVDFDLQTTKDRTSATYFAQRLHQTHQAADTTVVVIGGDGTLHDVLNGLARGVEKSDRLPLAYLPVGKRSRFARAYGISSDPATALQEVLAARSVDQVNVGYFRDTIKGQDGFFLNSIGIGFDAALLSHVNYRHDHFGWHRLPFWYHATSIVYDQQPFELMVNQRQRRFLYHHAFIAVISNHPFLDSGFQVSPASDLRDPVFDLMVAERRGWPLTLWQLSRFFHGKLSASRFATRLTGPSFHCTTTSLEFSQMDGKNAGNRFIDILVEQTTYPFRQFGSTILSTDGFNISAYFGLKFKIKNERWLEPPSSLRKDHLSWIILPELL